MMPTIVAGATVGFVAEEVACRDIVFFSASSGPDLNSGPRLPAPDTSPCRSISRWKPSQSKPRLCSAAMRFQQLGRKAVGLIHFGRFGPARPFRGPAARIAANSRSMRSRPASIVEKKLLSSCWMTCATRSAVSVSSG